MRCGDISYIRTWEGWLYLATVIDLASRQVVGWAMAGHMRTTLVSDALRMATRSRRPPPGLLFHTDRGSQYTSREFTALLAGHDIRQSLSRPRQCWDNAVAESWFATLKRKLLYRRSWPTRAEARQATSNSLRSSTTASACTPRSATSAPPSTRPERLASPPPPRRLSKCVP